jgi:hypothetical protein
VSRDISFPPCTRDTFCDVNTVELCLITLYLAVVVSIEVVQEQGVESITVEDLVSQITPKGRGGCLLQYCRHLPSPLLLALFMCALIRSIAFTLGLALLEM